MGDSQSPEVKLFAHYSLPRPETYAKIGGFVCGTPLHVTFAGITTRQPDTVMETLRDILAAPMELPVMQRDRMKLSYGHHRIKPIAILSDTANRLTELQTQVLDAIAPMSDTRIMARTQYTNGRAPHVTLDQLTYRSELPSSFTVDHIMVTSGTQLGPWHWHNQVWDIIYLRAGNDSPNNTST